MSIPRIPSGPTAIQPRCMAGALKCWAIGAMHAHLRSSPRPAWWQPCYDTLLAWSGVSTLFIRLPHCDQWNRNNLLTSVPIAVKPLLIRLAVLIIPSPTPISTLPVTSIIESGVGGDDGSAGDKSTCVGFAGCFGRQARLSTDGSGKKSSGSIAVWTATSRFSAMCASYSGRNRRREEGDDRVRRERGVVCADVDVDAEGDNRELERILRSRLIRSSGECSS